MVSSFKSVNGIGWEVQEYDSKTGWYNPFLTTENKPLVFDTAYDAQKFLDKLKVASTPLKSNFRVYEVLQPLKPFYDLSQYLPKTKTPTEHFPK